MKQKTILGFGIIILCLLFVPNVNASFGLWSNLTLTPYASSVGGGNGAWFFNDLEWTGASTIWQASANTYPQFTSLLKTNGTPFHVNKTTIMQYDGARTYDIITFRIQGSNDSVDGSGGNWTNLTNLITAPSQINLTYTFNNTGTFKGYRIHILSGNSNPTFAGWLLYGETNPGGVASKSLSLSVNDTKVNTLATGFTFNVTNISGSTLWSGICASTSCSNSSMSNFSNGFVYFSNVTPNIYNVSVSNVSFDNSVDVSVVGQSLQKNKTLVFNYWLSGNTSFNVSVPLNDIPENTSLSLGFSVRTLSSDYRKIQIVYNGTVVSDVYSNSYGTGTFPFRLFSDWNNSASMCDINRGVCYNSLVVGGEVALNDSLDIVSSVNGINGSVDEIMSDVAVTGSNVSAYSNAFFLGLMQDPVMSFDTNTYVSNLFIPNLSLSMSPGSITINDNSNLSISFFDGDFESGSNVTLQWRVNNSLLRTTVFNISNGSQTVSDLLGKGNYSKGATINVTAWANDGMYVSANVSQLFVVGGIRPNPVTSLGCGAINKTSLNCNWTNPLVNVSIVSIYLNSSNIANVSNVTTSVNILGLLPDNYYNVSLITISFDGTPGNTTTNITFTSHNLAPNITDYSPSNLSPSFDEFTNQTFSVNASDDDTNLSFYWFKNSVFQFFGSVWSWIIGKNDQGNYNITVIVNDSFGASTSKTWNVTVLNTYPEPLAPVFKTNGGSFRTYIPLSCVSPNSYSSVSYYDITMSVNGTPFINLSQNNIYGALDFDITPYNFGSTFLFNCTAVGDSGNSSGLSNTFTRDYVNEFYSTTTNYGGGFESLNPYTMSIYYDISSTDNNIFVDYSYADCNGDGLYDYVYNYTSAHPSTIKQYYQCVFPKGTVNYDVGVLLSKTDGTSWGKSGCNNAYDYSNTCLLKKTYTLVVS